MGIYHKYDIETESSTWIMLQPAPFALKIPDMLFECYKPSPIETHLYLLQSTLQMWNSYFTNVESQVRKDVSSFR